MTWTQMCKSQCKNMRNMKKWGNITPPKLNNFIVTNANDKEMDEITKNWKNDHEDDKRN
jgi:hypothetical protein